MTAKYMLQEFGTNLIGREIVTEPFGDWPGGIAKVTELTPDPKAPEIVFQVYQCPGRSIGVFDFEEVEFFHR